MQKSQALKSFISFSLIFYLSPHPETIVSNPFVPPAHASVTLAGFPSMHMCSWTCILFLTVISPPISIWPILFSEVIKSLFFTSLGSTNCLVLCLYNLWLMLTGHQHMVGSLSRRPPLLGYRKLRKELLSFKLLSSQKARPGRGCLLVSLMINWKFNEIRCQEVPSGRVFA